MNSASATNDYYQYLFSGIFLADQGLMYIYCPGSSGVDVYNNMVLGVTGIATRLCGTHRWEGGPHVQYSHVDCLPTQSFSLGIHKDLWPN